MVNRQHTVKNVDESPLQLQFGPNLCCTPSLSASTALSEPRQGAKAITLDIKVEFLVFLTLSFYSRRH